MNIHLIDGELGLPVCWGGEHQYIAVMLHADLKKVTCRDCLEMHKRR